MTIQLKRFHQNDIPQLLSWIDSAAFCMQWGGPSFQWPLTKEQLQTYIKENDGEEPERLIFKAVDGETGETVGHISLGKLDRGNKTGRIGKVLVGNPDHRGKGIAGQMVTAICRIGFEELSLERISLGVFDFNAAAVRAYERVGFRQEGLMRSFRQVGQERWNLIEMAMLKEDWMAKHLTHQWEGFKPFVGASIRSILGERLIFQRDWGTPDQDVILTGDPVLHWARDRADHAIEREGFLRMNWYEHESGEDELQVQFQDTPDPLPYVTDIESPNRIIHLVSEYSFGDGEIEQITGYGFLEGDQGYLCTLIFKIPNGYVTIESFPGVMEIRIGKQKPERSLFDVLLFEWGRGADE
ncbi:GNAT family N-acetyltransferase [Salisediminibacterium beveridgei]|uniref:Acetyltransferase, GNAT family n=1 Tax=Salisediminibacterium beveridgei TaxID=632773 RepID=A0A1D7QYG9_9BACI|nr:GNAT family protein [Salisediminibacterium beveridgei]AOM84053.1 acetyltransferase, GNAT family [Salisediminibacterium beveridgei]